MTSEERFAHIEETLVQTVDIQREQAETQRRQAALMLEIAHRHADLAERVDTVIGVVERFLSRDKNGGKA
jgi:hypothetical protein